MYLDLKESARQWVLANLPYDKNDADLHAYLISLDVHALLVIYHNWMMRLIPAMPRNVHCSKTLLSKMNSLPNNSDLTQIILDIETGADLTRYLSRDTVRHVASVPRKGQKFNKRRDLDLLLIDWGIHHLHISTLVKPDGFVKSADYLLFGVFKEGDAFLIDVRPHQEKNAKDINTVWYKKELIKILMNELPQAEVVHEIKGISGISPNPDEERIRESRLRGMNLILEIDGKFVTTLGMISLSGTGMKSTRAADHLLESIEAFESWWGIDKEDVRKSFTQFVLSMPAHPYLEFYISPDHGAGILEVHTGWFCPLERLRI